MVTRDAIRRRPAMEVAAVAVAAMGLHALFLGVPLAPDEGGYLLVARQWHGGGPFLYGQFFVDRPPLLIATFAVAGLGGAFGIHLLATLCAGVVVLAAGWAGWAVAGNAAARWSALIAAELSASTLIDAQELDGELLAIPFVMVACALLLHAWYRAPRLRYVFAVAAGISATAALLVKQNFVEGLVFAAVFLGLHVLRGTDRRAAVLMAAGFGIGAAGSLAVVVTWAASQGKLGALWFATVTFRAEAGSVIRTASWHAPGARLVQMIVIAGVTGIVVLSVLAGLTYRSALRRRDPLAWALAAGFGVEVAGVVLGGSFWMHYLVGIIPMLSLAVGTAAARGLSWHTPALRVVVLLACAVTVVTAPIDAAKSQIFGKEADRVGSWLGRAAATGDTAVVTFTHPNVLQSSGLSSPYPYLWSLPARTLDPHLALLERTVQGPRAPTWIVEFNHFDTWHLDVDFAKLVASRYRVVAKPCGYPVWLRDDVTRTIPGSLGC